MHKKGTLIPFLIVGDALLIIFAFIFSYYLRFHVLWFVGSPGDPVVKHYLGVMVFIVLIWLAIFKFFGLYEEKRTVNLFDESANLFLAVLVSALVLASLLFLYKEFWFSRQVIGYAWLSSFIFLVLFRYGISWLQRLLYSRGLGISRLLIVGAGEIGQAIAARAQSSLRLGIKVVGFVDDDPIKAGKEFYGVPVLGNLSRIKEIIRSYRVDEVVISSTDLPSAQVLDIITECEGLGVEFKIIPGLLEIMASRVDTGEIAGIPLVTIAEVQWVGYKPILKRGVDLVAALVLLILLSPLLLLVALAIKLDSRGSVLFGQERVGKDGKVFTAYKFRSMVVDAEKLFEKVKHMSEVEGHVFKMKADPRVTRVGKWLRKFSLDELPQLINVLCGEMSLVGPRPPIPREVANYSAWHKKRLRITPGITGLWQVSGRSEIPFEEMVRLDIYYIENWSLWQDCKILLMTFPAVVFGKGAY
ncbi:MAG: undecaprenyl-phosphate glucose phosphotransferase [Candidatus Margulisiibacteriota bacterium]